MRSDLILRDVVIFIVSILAQEWFLAMCAIGLIVMDTFRELR